MAYSRVEILRIFELIEEDTLSPEEQARIMGECRDKKYHDDKFKTAMQKGIEMGVVKQAQETVQAMLNEGIDISLIKKFTGLTVAEILQLQKNNE